MPDGSLDPSFNPNMVLFNQDIYSVASLSNGNIACGNTYNTTGDSKYVNGLAIADTNGYQVKNLNVPTPIGYSDGSIEKISEDSQGRIYAMYDPNVSFSAQTILSLTDMIR